MSGGDALKEVVGESQPNRKRHCRLSIAHAQRCLQRLYRLKLHDLDACALVAHGLREDCVHARLAYAHRKRLIHATRQQPEGEGIEQDANDGYHHKEPLAAVF